MPKAPRIGHPGEVMIYEPGTNTNDPFALMTTVLADPRPEEPDASATMSEYSEYLEAVARWEARRFGVNRWD